MNAGLIFSTRPGALSCSRRTSSPHPAPRMPRFSPALARTLRPGSSRVPFAARVMPAICRSSTRITSNRRAMSVLALLGPVLPPVRLPGPQPGDRVLDPAAAVRSRLRAGERVLQCAAAWPAPAGQGGGVQQLAGGQGGGDRHPPVNAHRLAVTGGGNRRRDHRERDMPPAGPVPGHPVGLHARRHRTGPAEPHPPGLGHPDLTGFPADPAHVPLPPAPPGDPEPLIPPGLAPRRPPGPVARIEEPGHRPAEVAQRLLLHHLGAGRQPRVLRPRAGELPALLQVTRRACPARAPVPVLLDGQVPHVPGLAAVVPQHRFLGGGGEQPVPRHANTLSNTADNSGEVKRRFLPRLKAGASTPQS